MSWLAILPLVVLIGISLKYCWWLPPVSDQHPRILMYHMICESSERRYRGLRVHPARFAKQVAWLKDNGWTFVTMSDLERRIRQHADLRRIVALTFDDGYADNYYQALPVLRQHGAKATLYLVVNRHSQDWSVKKKAHHDGGELMREPKLSDEQVQEMLAEGTFELGGHTLNHCHLPSTQDQVKIDEIAGCKQALEATFGQTVTSFAYPFGHYGQDDVRIVREQGFGTGVTTKEGINKNPDLMQLKRIKVSGKDNFLAFWIRMRLGFRGLI